MVCQPLNVAGLDAGSARVSLSMTDKRERLEQEVFDLFGIQPGTTDYNLYRIARLAALGTSSRYSVITMFAPSGTLPVVAYNVNPDEVDLSMLSSCQVVQRTGQAVFAASPSGVIRRSEPDISGDLLEIGSVAAVPVYDAGKKVVGALCVARSRILSDLDAPTIKTILNDCVRLVEDSMGMRRDAMHDGLTGLYNRRTFDQQIEVEWRRSLRDRSPMSLLILDIDEFKAFNDAAGHIAGDNALRRVACAITQRVRRAGDFACRFGGEEFAVILPSTDIESALLMAQSIRANVAAAEIEHPAHPDGPGRRVTVSIGVATVDERHFECYSPEQMLALVDSALYRAKANGRDRVEAGTWDAFPETRPGTETAESSSVGRNRFTRKQ